MNYRKHKSVIILNGGKMKRIFIVGWGPTADEVFYFINKYKLFEVAGFVQYKKDICENNHNGLPVNALEDLDSVIDREKDFVFAAMFWDRLNDIRRVLYEELKARGYKIASLISPNADTNGAAIGENCWIQDNVYIKPFAEIGDNTYLDTGSFIGLNSKVGKHCYIAGKALVAGFCTIGNQTFVGLNSTVFDHTDVGSLCIVGATVGLKRNIPDCSVVKTSGDNTVVKSYEKELMPDKLVAERNLR